MNNPRTAAGAIARRRLNAQAAASVERTYAQATTRQRRAIRWVMHTAHRLYGVDVLPLGRKDLELQHQQARRLCIDAPADGLAGHAGERAAARYEQGPTP